MNGLVLAMDLPPVKPKKSEGTACGFICALRSVLYESYANSPASSALVGEWLPLASMREIAGSTPLLIAFLFTHSLFLFPVKM